MSIASVRVAVALSGGVDSAVAALFLRRCVPRWADVEALWRTRRPLALREVVGALEQRRPWSEVVACAAATAGTAHNPAAAVRYFPLFMRNWEDASEGDGAGRRWCEAAQQDYHDATDVARLLGLLRQGEMLPLHNYSACYVERCFQPMLHAYARGETLNVDVLCNEEVKFQALLDALLAAGRADYLATGHYARTVAAPRLCGSSGAAAEARVIARPFSAGNDLNDQTVFLSRLSTKQALRAIFPLGHVFARKAEVRAVADHFGMKRVSAKKTSTGLCFVGEHYKKIGKDDGRRAGSCVSGFRSFLGEYIAPDSAALQRLTAAGRRTTFMNAETGAVVEASELALRGEGGGPLLPAYSLTLGQLVRGSGEGGKLARYYVQRKDLFSPSGAANDESSCHDDWGYARQLRTVWLVDRWDHPLLYATVAQLRDVALPLHPRWLAQQAAGEVRLRCRCCARHQEPLRPAELCFAWGDAEESEDRVRVARATVRFEEPVRALTAGQALVSYISLAKEGAEDAAGWFVAASGWIA
ncbi:tRNA-methyl transferase [Trypanosoma conorhini]|uniref:tRNA-methyl transferase n=1 Tax=Trypanosoma conorhini TaxID=83891 RepID=A0A422Q8B8_9TRYP|nr:tRNA-methyl transferase [Trypanosoma conorhini]RNF26189.1 tRNA-methyl transferase [Trypanosoma conorhini]